ncbi:hypothetical protein LJC08_02650 [Methanimicrococcus sp. OttesenSCG-928-J09]|nr:hypothetical protein [Methanimicrococcus sp. OttesenSCG-928-J09]
MILVAVEGGVCCYLESDYCFHLESGYCFHLESDVYLKIAYAIFAAAAARELLQFSKIKTKKTELFFIQLLKLFLQN